MEKYGKNITAMQKGLNAQIAQRRDVISSPKPDSKIEKSTKSLVVSNAPLPPPPAPLPPIKAAATKVQYNAAKSKNDSEKAIGKVGAGSSLGMIDELESALKKRSLRSATTLSPVAERSSSRPQLPIKPPIAAKPLTQLKPTLHTKSAMISPKSDLKSKFKESLGDSAGKKSHVLRIASSFNKEDNSKGMG